ncbi:MAG: (4Fe-4S)-binding protein, partial [Thermoanaerobaculia bacterium]|nr:(4Fe-4S)-binding protein [Thermoanaerobaculia bacterium]
MSPKIHSYPAEDITVEFNTKLCIHSAVCVRGLPAVFDTSKRPWVDATQAPADRIAEIVGRCPSGALQFRRTDGGAEEAMPTENHAQVQPRGPLYVTGDVRLEGSDGSTVKATRVALCRCGASKNKPHCDNSHQQCDFDDPALAMEDRLKPADGEPDTTYVTFRMASNGPILVAGPLTVTCSDDSASCGTKGAL